jgi:UDP-glucose 4-epimerase
MKNVLVTGGAGFIGSHVVDLLLAEGCRVSVIDNFRTGSKQRVPNDVPLYEADVAGGDISAVFEEVHPDAVVHLAAQGSVGYSVEHPQRDAETNITGTVQLLNLSVEHGVKKFVFASTAAVYGDQQALPIKEAAELKPESPYALSKWTAERYMAYYNRQFGLNGTVLRFANVYGPRQEASPESGVITLFVHQLLQRSSPTIFGDGQQTRDFIYVGDVAGSVWAALHSSAAGTFNVSTATEISIGDLYRQLCRLTGVEKDARYAPFRKGDIYRSSLCNEKITSELDWCPEVPMEEGLKKTIDYFLTSI